MARPASLDRFLGADPELYTLREFEVIAICVDAHYSDFLCVLPLLEAIWTIQKYLE